MKLPIGNEDTPWLLFVLAAAVVAMALLSDGTHQEHPQSTAAATFKK